MKNNCVKCIKVYEKYIDKKGDEDVGASYCILPVYQSDENANLELKEPKGLCQFCNPRSIFYLNPEKCYSLSLDCNCNKINEHSGLVCSEHSDEEKRTAYLEKRKQYEPLTSNNSRLDR